MWGCQEDSENRLGVIEDYMVVDLPTVLTAARDEGIHASRITAEANSRTQICVGTGGANALTQPLTNRLDILEAHLNAQSVELRRITTTYAELAASNE